MGKLFGTDGVRGVAGKDLTCELALQIGRGTAAVLTAEIRGNIAAWIRRQNWSIRWTLYYALGLGILFYGAFGQSVFIYQQY